MFAKHFRPVTLITFSILILHSTLCTSAEDFNVSDAASFSTEAVGRMKDYYEAHKKGTDSPEDCITILNGAVRDLLSDQNQAVASAIHSTMDRLTTAGHASARRDIEYKNASGGNTSGVTKPESAGESVTEVAEQACVRRGWYVFGLSVADGYHSMTLAIDNTGENAKFFLADQNEGWVSMSSADVDSKILSWTQRAWDDATPSTRPRTRTTLWRLVP